MADLKSNEVLTKISNVFPRMCELNFFGRIELEAKEYRGTILARTWTEDHPLLNITDWHTTCSIKWTNPQPTTVSIEWNDGGVGREPSLLRWAVENSKLVLYLIVTNQSTNPELWSGKVTVKYQEQAYNIVEKQFMPSDLRYKIKKWALFNLHGWVNSTILYPYDQSVSEWIRLDLPPNLLNYHSILDLTQPNHLIQLEGAGCFVQLRIDNETNKCVAIIQTEDENLFQAPIKIQFLIVPYEVW